MRRQRATASAIRSAVAAAWLRAFYELRSADVAMVKWCPDDDATLAAIDDVEALVPGTTWDTVAIARPRVSPRKLTAWLLFALVIPFAFKLANGRADATESMIAGDEQKCTFSDGTTVPGECMFEDTFTSLDTNIWNAEDNWNGPLQNVIPDVSCFRHENVAVSGGTLNLSMTANARASCPQTWSTTAFYTSNYGVDWPIDQPTSYDVGVVSMKTFHFTYGHVQMSILLPPGRGPGGDVTLWGSDCQKSAGVIDALSDLFTTDVNRSCDWPNSGSTEMDMIQSSRSGATTTINTSHYVAASPGSPSPIGNFFGTDYFRKDLAIPVPLSAGCRA